MDAQTLNEWAMLKAQGRANSTFVPQLSTGTMPPSQASSVARSLPEDAIVAENQQPFVDGGYPQNLAAPGTPGTQNQRYIGVNGAPAPWVQVPACAAARTKRVVKSVGLQPLSAASLNYPVTERQPLSPRVYATTT